MKALKEFMIDVVNPRFRWFDKPLCLALLVGACTAVITVILFYYSSQQCTTHSDTFMYFDVIRYASGMEHWAGTKPGLKCVHWAKFPYQIESTSAGKQGTYSYFEVCKPPLPESVQRCPDISENFMAAIKVADENEGSNKIADIDEIAAMTPFCGEAPHLYLAGEASSWQVDESLLPMVEYDICPDFLTTFGASLGWAGLIEVAVTVLVVGCLQGGGCLKGRKHSEVGRWLVQMTKDGLKDLEVLEGMESKIEALDKFVKALKADFDAAKKKDPSICQAA